MTDREAIKQRFLLSAGFSETMRQPLPGDASTRRYERLVRRDGTTFMLMDQARALESQPCRLIERGADETPLYLGAIEAQARILGIFARLVVHFHKPPYEAFIPRMWGHIARNIREPGMEGLREWFLRHGFGDKLA